MAEAINQSRTVVGRREPEELPDEDTDYEREEEERIRRQRALDGIEAYIGTLQGLADEQVSKKAWIEERWLEDLRQYHGRYAPQIEADLKADNKSRLFINVSRSKTHAWEARLSDMLFPTDDKNWGIRPTPVPELSAQVQKGRLQARGLTERANLLHRSGQVEQAQQLAAQAQPIALEAAQARQTLDEAKRRSEAMAVEIEDQLIEAQYGIKSRQIIHDACKLGTGIMKGPLSKLSRRRSWQKSTREGEENIFVLGEADDPRQDWQRTNPWNFFPDMSALDPSEWEFTFERHILNEKELRGLAKKPGFNKDNIRLLITEGNTEGLPPYFAQLREIGGVGQQGLEDRYIAWEFHGQITHDDLVNLCDCFGDDMTDYSPDPLDEYNVIIWFCQGKLLKWGPHPLETGDSLYSIFNFEKDDTVCFGYGVPYAMKDSQAAMNGAWRMMMDNGGLSTGPQVIVDPDQIEPVNGSWELTPRKVWRRTKQQTPGGAIAFEMHEVKSNQSELASIIGLARQFSDDETNMPLIAQGESAGHITDTAEGMAMLMNSVNVVFRRVVKNYDDDMTTPNIRRAYDWTMQNSPKEALKGDYEIDARGSSVLLVREIQAQNLMAMALQFSGHPVLGPITKTPGLYRKLVQAHMLPPDEIVMTDDEIEQEKAKQKEKPNPEIVKLQMTERIANNDNLTKLDLAMLQRETALMQLAAKHNITLSQLQGKLQVKDMELKSKERIMAAEAALEREMGRTTASGGYL